MRRSLSTTGAQAAPSSPASLHAAAQHRSPNPSHWIFVDMPVERLTGRTLSTRESAGTRRFQDAGSDLGWSPATWARLRSAYFTQPRRFQRA